MRRIVTKEHAFILESDQEKLSQLNLPHNNSSRELLGLSSWYQVGYFIGARWLREQELSLVVEPKIENLDYFSMFLTCLNHPRTTGLVGEIYDIDFNQSPIPLPSKQFDLTPLIIIHFLSVMRSIVYKGLKRDYIQVEENLQSKIKGKLLASQHNKKNVFRSRFDRNMCRYQEYSLNCIENRILKKTLAFVGAYLDSTYVDSTETKSLYNIITPAFSNVSDNVSLRQLKHLKHNSLFKEYNEALRLAEMILKRFSYAVENTKEKVTTIPPFTIDMSLLFELYVLTKLDAIWGNAIQFQYHGKYGAVDFLDVVNKRIIDTKYKLRYDHKYVIEDIRQLSGYGRDVNVLKKMKIDLDKPEIPECVIIYPAHSGNKEILEESFVSTKISQFLKFYKYGIKLPLLC